MVHVNITLKRLKLNKSGGIVMSDSYISYGSDGSYHIIRPIGEGFDIETAFLIALGLVAIYVMWHYSPKEVWNKIKSYFKE